MGSRLLDSTNFWKAIPISKLNLVCFCNHNMRPFHPSPLLCHHMLIISFDIPLIFYGMMIYCCRVWTCQTTYRKAKLHQVTARVLLIILLQVRMVESQLTVHGFTGLLLNSPDRWAGVLASPLVTVVPILVNPLQGSVTFSCYINCLMVSEECQSGY